LPAHAFASGTLDGTGDCKAWPITVSSLTEPLAVTMVMPTWTGSNAPNFDIQIRTPQGTVAANQFVDPLLTGPQREEQIGFTPTATGVFTLRVLSVASSGPYWFDLSGGTLGATPDECAGVVYAGGPVDVSEAGPTSDTYTVALNSAPSATVTVTLTSDSFESVAPNSLQFTTANWNSPRTVTVTAIDDVFADGNPHTGTITASLSSSDPIFNGTPAKAQTVSITDNDIAGLDLSRTSLPLAEAGSTSDSYTVALHTHPRSTVTVQLQPSAQVTVNPSTLTFTGANWQSPQTVTVQAVDDNVTEPTPHAGTVHHALTSSDGQYNGLGTPDLVASITDNDLHGLAGGGYRLLASDGGIFTFGNAGFFGSTGNQKLNSPIVGMATTPSGAGYWLVATDGGIFTFGDAGFFGSTGALKLNSPIVGMAATPSGRGYWLVARDGGIFAFGDAGFFGSTGDIRLNRPIVGMAATPSGRGYWLVASDGGIFAFGDAGFFGSTGALHLNSPVIAMAATPDGHGYWLLAGDGGIFTFGNAGFFGSTGNLHLNAPVVGFAATPFGAGYWLVASDGGIFTFGDAQFFGSTGNLRLNRPVIAMAA
jgi:hypothetical protein